MLQTKLKVIYSSYNNTLVGILLFGNHQHRAGKNGKSGPYIAQHRVQQWHLSIFVQNTQKHSGGSTPGVLYQSAKAAE